MGRQTERVWVTGANGFLGRAVCRALARHEVTFVRVGRTNGATAATLPHERAGVLWDLRESLATKLAPGDRPTAIFHLAAERPENFHAGDVRLVAASNLQIDRHIFDVAAEFGCHVIYASGCSVYGSRTTNALSEDAVCTPLGPYPAAKLQAESEAAALDDAGELRFASLRVSAPYGPDQSARTVLWNFVSLARDGADLEYHGSGMREQDFIHADDVGQAFVHALTREARGIFNVARGEAITMRALAERVVALTPGSQSRITASGRPDPQDDLRARYDTERARAVLGWSPRVSLDEGLAECIAAARARDS